MDGIMIYATAFQICSSYDTDTQCRLVGCMARYALTGEEPDFREDDPARFVWPALKEKADRTVSAYEQRVAAGRNGGIKTQAQRKRTASERVAEAKRHPSEHQATPKQPQSEAEAEAKPESNTESNTDTESDKKRVTRTREEAKAELDRFERFWAAYPKKVGKRDAVKAWGRLHPDDALLTRMLAAIEQQKQSDQWTRDGLAFVPNPSTWLNQERWTDELPKAVPRAKTVAAQQYEQRDYSQDEPEPQPAWMMERWQAMQREGTA